MILQLLDHLLDPLLEIAAIAGPGEQSPHVEGEDGRAGQDARRLAIDDLARKAFGNGGLAHPRIADQQRIVLGPAAQDLDAALHLRVTTDQGINLPLPRLFIEVDAVGVERLPRLRGGLVFSLGLRGAGAGAAHVAGLGRAGLLGDAVGDEVDRVVTGHVLLLQEEGRMALPLGEDGDQHIGSGHIVPTGRLHVDHGPLDHPLEPGRRLGVFTRVCDEGFQFCVQIVDQIFLQNIEIDAARLHDRRPFGVVQQG